MRFKAFAHFAFWVAFNVFKTDASIQRMRLAHKAPTIEQNALVACIFCIDDELIEQFIANFFATITRPDVHPFHFAGIFAQFLQEYHANRNAF